MNKKHTICWNVLVCNKGSVNARNASGMHGKQLHGKQLSSYKLQVWFLLGISQFLQASWICPVKEFLKRHLLLEVLVGLLKPSYY